MKNSIIIFLTLAMFFPTVAFSNESQIEHWLNRATMITIAKVTSGEEISNVDICRYKYKFSIEQSIKWKNEQPVLIISSATLTVGQRYLLIASEKSQWETRDLGNDVLAPPLLD